MTDRDKIDAFVAALRHALNPTRGRAVHLSEAVHAKFWSGVGDALEALLADATAHRHSFGNVVPEPTTPRKPDSKPVHHDLFDPPWLAVDEQPGEWLCAVRPALNGLGWRITVPRYGVPTASLWKKERGSRSFVMVCKTDLLEVSDDKRRAHAAVRWADKYIAKQENE